jgi:hypothetical protein
MKTKTIELYTFEELPKDVQEKVLDNERHINVEDGFWYDYDGKTGFSQAEIEKYGLKLEHADDLLTYKKVYFDCGRSWYIQFVDAEFKHDETARKFLGVPVELWKKVSWTINDQPYRETNTRLEWEYEYENDEGDIEYDPTPKELKIIEQAVERFSDKVEEALRGLEKSYEYAMSDESVKETLVINDYTFTITGKMEH